MKWKSAFGVAAIFIAIPALLFAGADSAQAMVQQGALQSATDASESFLARLGGWAYLLAPLLMIVVAILPIPAEFPAMMNGMLFGPVVGAFITWSGGVVGAIISFELARKFGRPMAERFVKTSLLNKVDKLLSSAGWPGLLFLRLLPIVAFTALNWGIGFTKLSRWTFIWTTALGILPGAILFTSSGTGLAALYRMNPLAAVGLGALGLLVLWLTVSRYRGTRLRLWTGEYRVADSGPSPN